MIRDTREALRRPTFVVDPETGRRFPMIAGGADDGAPDGGTTNDSDGADGSNDDGDDGSNDNDADDDTGGAGSKDAVLADLARERQRRKQERDRAKALEAEVARLKGETESEVDRARREAREETLGPALRAIRTAAVENVATAYGFQDPADVFSLVDLADIEVDDETLEVDRRQVTKAVEDLAKSKPYLLTEAGRAKIEGKSGASRGGADTQAGSRRDSNRNDPGGSFLDALRSKSGISGR